MFRTKRLLSIARLSTDLIPMVILIIVVVLLAAMIVVNMNRNQREIIRTVKEAVRSREEAIKREADATVERVESMIKSNMKDPANWETASDLMKPD